MNLWRKLVVMVVGGVLVLLGIIMLVIPGPGLLTIAAGVAVWATQYTWASELLVWVRARIKKLASTKTK